MVARAFRLECVPRRPETGSGQCQQWLIVDPSRPREDENFCLGVEDHLPRKIQFERASYEYYYWNVPIEIAVPFIDAPPAPVPGG